MAMPADMEKVVKPRVDATASKAIASRRGVERVRHLHTHVLWVREALARRELTIVIMPRVENPADMATKHLASPEDGRGWCLGSHRRLESAAMRLGNDRSSTSIEIDKTSRTSIEIDYRLSTS